MKALKRRVGPTGFEEAARGPRRKVRANGAFRATCGSIQARERPVLAERGTVRAGEEGPGAPGPAGNSFRDPPEGPPTRGQDSCTGLAEQAYARGVGWGAAVDDSRAVVTSRGE